MNAPVVYEVNLTIDPEVAEEYLAWLRPHIKEILQLKGFVSAELLKRDASQSGEEGKCTIPQLQRKQHQHVSFRIIPQASLVVLTGLTRISAYSLSAYLHINRLAPPR